MLQSILIGNEDKDNAVHSGNLKCCLQKGMEQIRKIIRFEQKKYRKDYIKFDTRMRAQSKTDVGKCVCSGSVASREISSGEVVQLPTCVRQSYSLIHRIAFVLDVF